MCRLSIILSVVLACTYAILFLIDFFTYRNGGRPWLSVNDDICGILFFSKRDNVVANYPVRAARFEFAVVHKWRGKYQFVLRVPEVYDDFKAVNEVITIKYTFLRSDGCKVFEYNDLISKNRWWTRSRDERWPGSDIAFRMYCAPKDVPLDENLTAVVQLLGDVEIFLNRYPQAQLFLEKRNDK